MTERNFVKELFYSRYADMEDGNDSETICYPSLISIITELCDRIEELENQVETLRWDKIRDIESQIEDLKYRTYD
jgi:beta-mannanase